MKGLTLYEKSPNLYANFPGITNKSALDLLEKFMKVDYKERITIEDALKHPFFESTEKLCNEENFYEIYSSLKVDMVKYNELTKNYKN